MIHIFFCSRILFYYYYFLMNYPGNIIHKTSTQIPQHSHSIIIYYYIIFTERQRKHRLKTPEILKTYQPPTDPSSIIFKPIHNTNTPRQPTTTPRNFFLISYPGSLFQTRFWSKQSNWLKTGDSSRFLYGET